MDGGPGCLIMMHHEWCLLSAASGAVLLRALWPSVLGQWPPSCVVAGGAAGRRAAAFACSSWPAWSPLVLLLLLCITASMQRPAAVPSSSSRRRRVAAVVRGSSSVRPAAAHTYGSPAPAAASHQSSFIGKTKQCHDPSMLPSFINMYDDCESRPAGPQLSHPASHNPKCAAARPSCMCSRTRKER